MNVDQVYGLLLIIVLFTHGISVPVPSSYFINEAPDQGLPVDDVTESESYERFPRNAFSSPYNYVQLQEPRWFPRSQVSARPRKPTRRHFHLFHLTAKHPNAVSYHVIQKPLVPRTISAPVKFGSNSRSSVPYNKRQYQPYATPSYYQQPATYQYPGYTSSNSPYAQNRVQNPMYQDIYQQVSNPMRFPSNPSSYTNQHKNDKALEEAAKEFTRISADMNNMELASLVMYPFPRLDDNHHTKIHKKKHKSKRKNKKKNKSKVSKSKLERKDKTVNNLVHTLLKNDNNKDKDDDKDMDYDGSGSADTWDEEDVASTGDQGYTSSKRSRIPHVIDTISNSDEDKTESSGDDASSKEHELDGASGQQESELGGGYVREDDVKDVDSDNKKQSTKPQADVEETEDEQGSGPLESDDEESGEQESEFGSGYVNKSDVRDDDSENEKRNSEKTETIVKKSDDR